MGHPKRFNSLHSEMLPSANVLDVTQYSVDKFNEMEEYPRTNDLDEAKKEKNKLLGEIESLKEPLHGDVESLKNTTLKKWQFQWTILVHACLTIFWDVLFYKICPTNANVSIVWKSITTLLYLLMVGEDAYDGVRDEFKKAVVTKAKKKIPFCDSYVKIHSSCMTIWDKMDLKKTVPLKGVFFTVLVIAVIFIDTTSAWRPLFNNSDSSYEIILFISIGLNVFGHLLIWFCCNYFIKKDFQAVQKHLEDEVDGIISDLKN